MESSVAGNQKGIFYGWWIVAISAFFNLIVSGTLFFGFTAFFNPLKQEFGWTSAQTALGFSLQRFEGGIVAPLVGFIFDRFGPRKLVLFGMAIAGAGMVFMSRINSLTEFYAAFLVTAIGVSIGWAGPPMYCVSNWFARKRTRALSYLMAGSSLGGIIVPLLVLLIAQAGWRTSLVVVGISFWLVSIPVAIMLRHRPETVGLLPDGEAKTEPEPISKVKTPSIEADFSVRSALKSHAFWLISFACMLSQFIATAVNVLEMPHLENIGISREVSGVAVTFTALMTFCGNLSIGFIGDRWRKSRVIALAFALQCAGVVILAFIGELWQLVPFVIIYGVGFGATMPMRISLMADYFGRTSLGTILGCLMSVTVIGSILSPVIAGWFYDINGNYRTIFVIFAVIAALSVPAILAAKRPVPKNITHVTQSYRK